MQRFMEHIAIQMCGTTHWCVYDMTVCMYNICLIEWNHYVCVNSPQEFKPLRFAPENSKMRAAYSFLPFSAGPR